MKLRSSSQTWGSVTRALHWISAGLILFGLFHGYWMTHFAPRPDRLLHYGWHSQVLVYLALLVAIRVAWRLSEPTPQQPKDSAAWERLAAHAGHLALYAGLVALLVSGYMLWSAFPARFRTDPAIASKLKLTLFGLDLPAIHARPDRAVSSFWEELHKFIAWGMFGLVVLHVAAALRHKFVKHNNVMARMWSGRAS